MSYRLLKVGVLRLADNKVIRRHQDPEDWAAYRAWLADGNRPEPMPTPPGPTVADVLDEVKDRITKKRDAVQSGGAVVGGVAVKTDPGSLSLLSQALQLSGRKPNRQFKVKTAERRHVQMTAAQIAGVFDALGERVALCWDAEAAHYEAVDAIAEDGSLTNAEKIAALRMYDFSEGWPA
jgi:hypothetical protein